MGWGGVGWDVCAHLRSSKQGFPIHCWCLGVPSVDELPLPHVQQEHTQGKLFQLGSAEGCTDAELGPAGLQAVSPSQKAAGRRQEDGTSHNPSLTFLQEQERLLFPFLPCSS